MTSGHSTHRLKIRRRLRSITAGRQYPARIDKSIESLPLPVAAIVVVYKARLSRQKSSRVLSTEVGRKQPTQRPASRPIRNESECAQQRVNCAQSRAVTKRRNCRCCGATALDEQTKNGRFGSVPGVGAGSKANQKGEFVRVREVEVEEGELSKNVTSDNKREVGVEVVQGGRRWAMAG